MRISKRRQARSITLFAALSSVKTKDVLQLSLEPCTGANLRAGTTGCTFVRACNFLAFSLVR